MYEKRTDLAIEARESFPGDDVEIPGVVLEEESYEAEQIQVTTVEIQDEEGARQMKKPVGTYATLEFSWEVSPGQLDERTDSIALRLKEILKKMLYREEEKAKRSCRLALVTGLGNRFATPDALGPYVLEKITMNRHIYRELHREDRGEVTLCGLAPGVMSQTGMETSEILQGVVRTVRPELLLVIDSLASRSVDRLCRTIQITNTGISPGAGIGNNRKQINSGSMGIPVIAIGVPTVVDAGTIVYETLEKALSRNGYSEEEIFRFFESIADRERNDLFVTPKDIDEEIRQVGNAIARGVAGFAAECHTLLQKDIE